jgi:hypothetical protein
MQNRREFSIRDCIFVQIQLMTYYHNEINRGLCHRGNFRLKPLYSGIKVDPQSISLRTVRSLEELTQYILSNSLDTDVTLPNLSLNSYFDSQASSQILNTQTIASNESSSTIESTQPLLTSTPLDVIFIETQESDEQNKEQNHPPKSPSQVIDIFYDNVAKLGYAECRSQEARAKWLVDNNRVKHLTEEKLYHVRSDSDKVYIVNLTNKPECTCPAKKNCVHILACKHSNGEELIAKNPVRVALSKLVSNKRNNRASGKKHLNNIKEKHVQVLNKHGLIKGKLFLFIKAYETCLIRTFFKMPCNYL